MSRLALSQEWIHCNKCMDFTPKQGNEILIGECGHFNCQRCLSAAQRDAQSPTCCCAVCGSSDGLWVSAVGKDLSPELAKVIVPIKEQIQELQGIWEFQDSNTKSIIAFLKEAAGSLQARLIKANADMQHSQQLIRDLQTANQELERQNQELRRGGGALGSTPATAAIPIAIPNNNNPNPLHRASSTQRFSLRPTSRGSSAESGGSFKPHYIQQAQAKNALYSSGGYQRGGTRSVAGSAPAPPLSYHRSNSATGQRNQPYPLHHPEQQQQLPLQPPSRPFSSSSTAGTTSGKRRESNAAILADYSVYGGGGGGIPSMSRSRSISSAAPVLQYTASSRNAKPSSSRNTNTFKTSIKNNNLAY